MPSHRWLVSGGGIRFCTECFRVEVQRIHQHRNQYRPAPAWLRDFVRAVFKAGRSELGDLPARVKERG